MNKKIRIAVQALSAALLNGYAAGFLNKKIYTGKLKGFCVPVLNCYSCPGAFGSCPIGALQTVIGYPVGKFPFYTLGIIMIIGICIGRLACGIICPFGFLQDLLVKIPLPKIRINKKIDNLFRFLKYLILIIFVIILPALFNDSSVYSLPYFCKYVCPAGTMEGGIFHVLTNSSLHSLIGVLFDWKLAILIGVLLFSIFIPRFFCRYLCPLGGFYSLFNRISLFRLDLDRSKCIDCGKCERACPMAVDIRKNINSGECIRCGICRAECPTDAIEAEKLFALARKNENP